MAVGHPLACCPRHCPHPHHDEPRSMLRCDHLAECATAPAPRPRPAQSCSMCGRDEGDDCGVIIDGACGDCRRAWS